LSSQFRNGSDFDVCCGTLERLTEDCHQQNDQCQDLNNFSGIVAAGCEGCILVAIPESPTASVELPPEKLRSIISKLRWRSTCEASTSIATKRIPNDDKAYRTGTVTAKIPNTSLAMIQNRLVPSVTSSIVVEYRLNDALLSTSSSTSNCIRLKAKQFHKLQISFAGNKADMTAFDHCYGSAELIIIITSGVTFDSWNNCAGDVDEISSACRTSTIVQQNATDGKSSHNSLGADNHFGQISLSVCDRVLVTGSKALQSPILRLNCLVPGSYQVMVAARPARGSSSASDSRKWTMSRQYISLECYL
jgi:hypothetical protein